MEYDYDVPVNISDINKNEIYEGDEVEYIYKDELINCTVKKKYHELYGYTWFFGDLPKRELIHEYRMGRLKKLRKVQSVYDNYRW